MFQMEIRQVELVDHNSNCWIENASGVLLKASSVLNHIALRPDNPSCASSQVEFEELAISETTY